MARSMYRQLNLFDTESCQPKPIAKELGVKTCIYCKKQKELSDFPKHILYKDNLDTRCRKCIKEQSKITRDLRKSAPPKPDVCECCGKIPLKWCLDHDHTNNTFRGWVCDRCNTGIGKLGDNIEGLQKAISYLRKNNV